MLTTTDIYLAAALMSLGAKLDNVNRDDPRHMEFAMEMDKPTEFKSVVLEKAMTDGTTLVNGGSVPIQLKEFEKQWMNGELMVNAVKFAEAIKRMKSVVHSR